MQAKELESVATERDSLIEAKPKNCFCAFWQAPVADRARPAYGTVTGITGLLGTAFLAAGVLSENAPAIVGGAILAAVALTCGYKTFLAPADTTTTQPTINV